MAERSERASDASTALRGRSLAIYLPDLSGGGTEHLHLGLAPHFQRAGLSVTLLLNKAAGELMGVSDVSVVSLDTEGQVKGLPRLIRHLRRARPDLLVANMEHMNVMALLAARMARVPTLVFACQHNTLSKQAAKPGLKNRLLPLLYRMTLPLAAGIVAVSKGVALDLNKTTGTSHNRIKLIYNGVVTDDFDMRAGAAAPYPWLQGDGPLIVAVGRMVPQKDYPTLLRAFASLARHRPARLAILGEGPMRRELETLATTLNIAGRVTMPGFLANPLAVISRSRLLVLSSQFEGFGLVLAEALACGVPVVSTDCPHGPSEILDGGRFGALVPVGDHEALAGAMATALDNPVDRNALRQRGRSFTLDHCAAQYLDLFRHALSSRPAPAEVASERTA